MTTNSQGCEGCEWEHYEHTDDNYQDPCEGCKRICEDKYQKTTKRIHYGKHSFPEPVREALEDGQAYWMVIAYDSDDNFCTCQYTWRDSPNMTDLQSKRIVEGRIQLTEQGAIDQLAAIKALCNGELSNES